MPIAADIVTGGGVFQGNGSFQDLDRYAFDAHVSHPFVVNARMDGNGLKAAIKYGDYTPSAGGRHKVDISGQPRENIQLKGRVGKRG